MLYICSYILLLNAGSLVCSEQQLIRVGFKFSLEDGILLKKNV